MDLFFQVIRDFTFLPHAGSGSEAEKLFQAAASRRPDHWLIPARACQAVGGSQEQAVPAVLAVGCAHVGILLVDDMLDEDRAGPITAPGCRPPPIWHLTSRRQPCRQHSDVHQILLRSLRQGVASTICSSRWPTGSL